MNQPRFKPLDHKTFCECLAALEVPPNEWNTKVRTQDGLDTIRKDIKKRWRKHVQKIHPDRGGSEDAMKTFNHFIETLDRLKPLGERRPQPGSFGGGFPPGTHITIVTFRGGFGSPFGATTTTASGFSTPPGWSGKKGSGES